MEFMLKVIVTVRLALFTIRIETRYISLQLNYISLSPSLTLFELPVLFDKRKPLREERNYVKRILQYSRIKS